MHVHTFHLGDYQTNTYIIENEGHCAIIDPGYEAETILAFLKKRELTVDAILLTHGHFDHVGGVKKIADKTGCRVFLHRSECTLPPYITSGELYYTDFYGEGDEITLAGLIFTVLHTPGHTPGSVCLCFDGVMLTGDTLFAGSCGRTDLPGGDWKTMEASLKRLAALEGDCAIYPGHGESTTLEKERRCNPYF